MEKLQVEIVFDGKSVEHEVSLQSAKNIVDAIDKGCFGVVLPSIDKQGQWYVGDASSYLLNADDPAHVALRPSVISLTQMPDKREHQLIDVQDGQPLPTVDIIFPTVHGMPDEDGSLQGMLQVTNLPFVGSDVLALAACMDRDVTKRLLRDTGLNIVPSTTLTHANRHNINFAEVESKLGSPLSVESANQGSSVGVSRVISEERCAITVDLAFEFDHKAIAEQGIKSRKIRRAVPGNDSPQISTCGEIVLASDSYAYDTKYIDEGGAKAVVPADIALEVNDKIRAIAVQAYQMLGCVGVACVDVFLTPENEAVINEISTLPGFINISVYPKLWQVSGLGYTDLITRLTELTLGRHTADNALKTTM